MANEIIDGILNSGKAQKEIIEMLKEKTVSVPAWSGANGLLKEYDPMLHPVMNKQTYPDILNEDGTIERVTRIPYDMQRLAVKRMTSLVCGIPIKRVYKPEGDTQGEIARWLEAIFLRNRIDSVNVERCNQLFASCEVMTLWYATENPNNYYGFDSPLKLRCRNFSPMLGDELYPYFDPYGDMVAMSLGYSRKAGRKRIQYFDTYTDDRHIKWSNESGDYVIIEDEPISLLKIPCVYMHRPTPIWEAESNTVYEIEWAVSRNGNYLRKNSRPIFAVFADEEIGYGTEKDEKEKFRSILQYPKGSQAQYVTWPQAIDSLKFYVTELRQSFFTQLQLPDWSYESMKSMPMSGESRKQLFIDCQLKVKEESGRLLEFFDREINVVKAFLKSMVPEKYWTDIDALAVEVEITPFMINDLRDKVDVLMAANGGKALISHRESVEKSGLTDDVDATMEQIAEDEQREKDVFNPYV